MKPGFAFLVHPLLHWHRRVMGVRRGHIGLALDHSAGIEAVGVAGSLTMPSNQGPVTGLIVAVPDTAAGLTSDQSRALAHQIRAAEIAIEHGVGAIGLANALGVVAGRGRFLAEQAPVPVTAGHAATAWAAIEITTMVAARQPGPIGVLGFKGTVGEAVAAALASAGHEVWVDATGSAAVRRAEKTGCRAATTQEVAGRAVVLVGGSTTGPVLAPSLVRGNTVLVDLALPPTLEPGPRPDGLTIVAGETLSLPGAITAGFWGRIWLTMANYGRGCVFACLAEPLVIAMTGESGWSEGRRLDPERLADLGGQLKRLGYHPVIRKR